MPTTVTHRKAWSQHAVDFIDDGALELLLRDAECIPNPTRVREILAKSLAKEALDLTETAVLVRTTDPELVEEICAAARTLKQNVYGNRVVLFAPLYIGNDCVNDCQYCAFKRSNRAVVRRTLDADELVKQVEALERHGHKRLILVFGEHPNYGPEFIADCVRRTYSVHVDHGAIRRVNINAAPLDHAGYRIVREAGIGTFQIFQETYHHATYARVHPRGPKAEYRYRLDGLSRAMEAGIDDVGIGVLFGLHDWRFEVLGLVAHARFLQQRYGTGPHTISFPRLRPAAGVAMDSGWAVPDQEFKHLVATLRLAVPYTGMICTAREPAALRREVMAMGVSQIDAGSRIEIGGYTEIGDAQVMECEQFSLGDLRSLDQVIGELLEDGYLPSFCTACYRLGRTGEHFMEFAIPGFIKRYCGPNALTTLAEYLIDYGSESTRRIGWQRIHEELAAMDDTTRRRVTNKLRQIADSGDRDLYF